MHYYENIQSNSRDASHAQVADFHERINFQLPEHICIAS